MPTWKQFSRRIVGVFYPFSNEKLFRVLAVSYEARTFGIKRGMSAVEARKLCPAINVRSIPPLANIHKADLSQYRNASDEVFCALEKFPNIVVEKASVDEAYIDLTGKIRYL